MLDTNPDAPRFMDFQVFERSLFCISLPVYYTGYPVYPTGNPIEYPISYAKYTVSGAFENMRDHGITTPGSAAGI